MWFSHRYSLARYGVASHTTWDCVSLNMILHDISMYMSWAHLFICNCLCSIIIWFITCNLGHYTRVVVQGLATSHSINLSGARHQGRQWRPSPALLRLPWSVGWGCQDNFWHLLNQKMQLQWTVKDPVLVYSCKGFEKTGILTVHHANSFRQGPPALRRYLMLLRRWSSLGKTGKTSFMLLVDLDRHNSGISWKGWNLCRFVAAEFLTFNKSTDVWFSEFDAGRPLQPRDHLLHVGIIVEGNVLSPTCSMVRWAFLRIQRGWDAFLIPQQPEVQKLKTHELLAEIQSLWGS